MPGKATLPTTWELTGSMIVTFVSQPFGPAAYTRPPRTPPASGVPAFGATATIKLCPVMSKDRVGVMVCTAAITGVPASTGTVMVAVAVLAPLLAVTVKVSVLVAVAAWR